MNIQMQDTFAWTQFDTSQQKTQLHKEPLKHFHRTEQQIEEHEQRNQQPETCNLQESTIWNDWNWFSIKFQATKCNETRYLAF